MLILSTLTRRDLERAAHGLGLAPRVTPQGQRIRGPYAGRHAYRVDLRCETLRSRKRWGAAGPRPPMAAWAGWLGRLYELDTTLYGRSAAMTVRSADDVTTGGCMSSDTTTVNTFIEIRTAEGSGRVHMPYPVVASVHQDMSGLTGLATDRRVRVAEEFGETVDHALRLLHERHPAYVGVEVHNRVRVRYNRLGLGVLDDMGPWMGEAA